MDFGHIIENALMDIVWAAIIFVVLVAVGLFIASLRK